MVMADMYGGVSTTGLGGDVNEDSHTEFYVKPRYPGLYVGNLTWWTTDQDVINAIVSVGITDVQEVKFFENRNNGQSKGFCVVTFNSEASLPIVMEKLPKVELYGQSPVVTPYNRQNLNLFESQTKTRPQINNGPGIMGVGLIGGVHANTQALVMNSYQQGGVVVGGFGGGLRAPHMRPMMRAPRLMMQPQQLPNHIIPGGHRMNLRMRFMQPQAGTSSTSRRVGDEISSVRRDEISSGRRDEISGRRDEISSGRREETSSSRRDEISSGRRDETSSSRRDEISSGRRDETSSGRRDERSSMREEKSFRREDKSLRHQSRPDDRARSRSRDRSRERKERRERRSERY